MRGDFLYAPSGQPVTFHSPAKPKEWSVGEREDGGFEVGVRRACQTRSAATNDKLKLSLRPTAIIAKMNLSPSQFVGLTLCVCLALMPATLPAQNEATPPSRIPGAKPSPSTSKVQDRISNAADQVMGRIQREESELYIRFSSFNKPTRLDPNAYSSKGDIALWQQSLQRLREKRRLWKSCTLKPTWTWETR